MAEAVRTEPPATDGGGNANTESPSRSFADVFRSTKHKQGVCILAILSWVAACDGKIAPKEQTLLDRISEAVDDAEELAVVEGAARRAHPRDLELACRYLKHNLDRGGKKLLAQLAVTMAIQDGYLTVSENLVLQFMADLLGLSPRGFGKLFEQIAHRPFPRAGDPSSLAWWQARESGEQARPDAFAAWDAGDGAEPLGAEEPMTHPVALRVMGLEEGASRDAIHATYRRLAKSRHPDRFAPLGPAAVATATEAFKRLHEAYAILSV